MSHITPRDQAAVPRVWSHLFKFFRLLSTHVSFLDLHDQAAKWGSTEFNRSTFSNAQGFKGFNLQLPPGVALQLAQEGGRIGRAEDVAMCGFRML